MGSVGRVGKGEGGGGKVPFHIPCCSQEDLLWRGWGRGMIV